MFKLYLKQGKCKKFYQQNLVVCQVSLQNVSQSPKVVKFLHSNFITDHLYKQIRYF